MIRRILVTAGLIVSLDACTGPPTPPPTDAFKGVFNQDSNSVPANAAVTVTQPIGLITSENVERYIGFIKDTNEYWGQRVPASLTNTVVIADSDPMYFSGKLLGMLKGHFPSLSKVHDFREAVAQGKKSVVLIDLRVKPGEPYGDRTTKIDVVAYFFDSGMNPVSKLSGHGEHYVPYASMDGGVQKSIDAALRDLDAKIRASVTKR